MTAAQFQIAYGMMPNSAILFWIFLVGVAFPCLDVKQVNMRLQLWPVNLTCKPIFQAQFRFYWIESKFNECPELKVKSAKNSFPLVSIPFSVCIKDNIESLLSLKDQSWDPLDGLLFYHKLGFYTPNVSPLVGWLKPFMLPEVIGVRVPDFYMKCQPKDYVNIKEYLKKTPKSLKEIFRS